jgi:subtilase-type serine protease
MMRRALFLIAVLLFSAPALAQNYEYTGQPNLAQIGVTATLHDTYSGAGFSIADFDSCEDISHPDLKGKQWSFALYPGLYLTPTAGSHGTAMGGVLAGKRDSSGIVGVAPGANLLTYCTTDDSAAWAPMNGTVRDPGTRFYQHLLKLNAVGWNARAILQAYEHYWNNGMSWGVPIFDQNELLTIDDYAANFVIVRAAGNDGTYITHQDYPYTDPAVRLGHLLIVGAVDANNVRASVSNIADQSCFYRNGYPWACNGALKDWFLVAPGVNVMTSRIGPTAIYPTPGYSYAALVPGTSQAAAQVAAAATLVAQARPDLTPTQIARILLDSATDLGAPGVDGIYGHGLLNVPAAIALALQ